MENRQFYVYKWYNADTNEVLYVGKGCGKRYQDKKHRNKLFLSYIEENPNVEVKIIYNNLSEQEAFKKEYEITEYYKKLNQCKCNLATAGHGGCHFIWTEEMKKYWSEYNPMKDPEQRKRMSQNNPMKNPETARKVGKKKKVSVSINGKIYEGIIDAQKELNVSSATIRQWCLNGYTSDGKECKYVDEQPVSFRAGKKIVIDNIVYNSYAEGAYYSGINLSVLKKAIYLHKKECEGHLIQEYANQQPSQ